MSVGRGLNSCTNAEDGTSTEQAWLTAESNKERIDEKCAEEATTLKGGNNMRRKCSARFDREAESALKRSQG